MDGEMTMSELVVSPNDAHVISGLGDAADWSAYAFDLATILNQAIETSQAKFLEVSNLIVDRPLPDRYANFRDGYVLEPDAAIEIVIEMAAGRGPYLSLSGANRLRIESGWDGAVHIFGPHGAIRKLAISIFKNANLEQREREPDPIPILRPVTAIADGIFWAQIESDAKGLVLLSERWAEGAYGSRWFHVDMGTVDDLAMSVQPGALLSVVVQPELYDVEVDAVIVAELIDDGFTSFRNPVGSGELDYRSYPTGVDSLADVAEGFSLILRNSLLSAWCAVVPGPDGAVRRWEHPTT
jgi:hypothetical protein